MDWDVQRQENLVIGCIYLVTFIFLLFHNLTCQLSLFAIPVLLDNGNALFISKLSVITLQS